MGEYKGCDIHDKEFPQNLVDTTKETMTKIYAEKPERIDGKDVTLSLFVGNNFNEGIDACHKHTMESLINKLVGMNIPISWKIITWYNEAIPKRDGSGVYNKLQKRVETIEEYKERAKKEKEEKAQKAIEIQQQKNQTNGSQNIPAKVTA